MTKSHSHYTEQKKVDTNKDTVCDFHLSEVQEKVRLICGDRAQDGIAIGLAERRHKGTFYGDTYIIFV